MVMLVVMNTIRPLISIVTFTFIIGLVSEDLFAKGGQSTLINNGVEMDVGN